LVYFYKEEGGGVGGKNLTINFGFKKHRILFNFFSVSQAQHAAFPFVIPSCGLQGSVTVILNRI